MTLIEVSNIVEKEIERLSGFKCIKHYVQDGIVIECDMLFNKEYVDIKCCTNGFLQMVHKNRIDDSIISELVDTKLSIIKEYWMKCLQKGVFRCVAKVKQ